MKLQCCKEVHHLLILYVLHILCVITLSVYLTYSEHVKTNSDNIATFI